MFCFCYIPQNDSQYFSYQSFVAIQEIISDDDCQYVIMGDELCGNYIRELHNYIRELQTRSETSNAQCFTLFICMYGVDLIFIEPFHFFTLASLQSLKSIKYYY